MSAVSPAILMVKRTQPLQPQRSRNTGEVKCSDNKFTLNG